MSFSAGTFSINSTGQPVVAGTTISASVFNAFTADIAAGLSTCMLKDGTQTATAGIGFYAGTVSLPGIYFGTDTATGFYRIGLNNTGFAINGTKLWDWSSTAATLTGTLTATTIGAFTLGGTIAGGGNQINNVIIGTSTPLAGSFTTLKASGAENLKVWTYTHNISAAEITAGVVNITVTAVTLANVRELSLSFLDGGAAVYPNTYAVTAGMVTSVRLSSTTNVEIGLGANAIADDDITLVIVEAA